MGPGKKTGRCLSKIMGGDLQASHDLIVKQSLMLLGASISLISIHDLPQYSVHAAKFCAVIQLHLFNVHIYSTNDKYACNCTYYLCLLLLYSCFILLKHILLLNFHTCSLSTVMIYNLFLIFQYQVLVSNPVA